MWFIRIPRGDLNPKRESAFPRVTEDRCISLSFCRELSRHGWVCPGAFQLFGNADRGGSCCVHAVRLIQRKCVESAGVIIKPGASALVSSALLQIAMRRTESRKFFVGGDSISLLSAAPTGCDTIVGTRLLFSNVCQIQCPLALHFPPPRLWAFGQRSPLCLLLSQGLPSPVL